jgi:CelD/BcsL family acetyltransferase involved in cellulose biosynthesis
VKQSRSGEAAPDDTAAILLGVDPDIGPFEADWERLFACPGNEPSTSFEWNRAMLRNHLMSNDRALLLGLTRHSELFGLALLVARPMKVLGCPVTVLCPITDPYNTHSDVLAGHLDETAIRAMFAALFELPVKWDVFRMSNLLEGHELLQHFVATVPRRGPPGLLRDGHASYYLDLPGTYETYLASRSSSFRNHLRRTQRRIDAERTVTVREYTRLADLDEGYALLLAIEQASWKHAHGTAISAVPRQRNFYHELCIGAAAHGRIHLQVLLLENRPAAYNLGYIREGTYFYLKTSYAERFKPLGVATYLRAALIRSLIERRFRCLDFPAAPYEWERQWTDTVRWHKTLTLYRPTAAGAALALADRLRTARGGAREVRHADPRATG